jgi:long-chain fatty acid transport protein
MLKLRVVAVAAPLLAGGSALATGFFVDQQDIRSLGRVNAGAAAAAEDPSTIFFNPAGLPYLWTADGAGASSMRLAVGVNLVLPRSRYTDAGSSAATPGTGGLSMPSGGGNFKNPADATPVPYFYLGRQLDDGYYLGFAVNGTFGQTARFDSTWFGRYDATDAQLKTINLSAVVARSPFPGLTLGGGIDLMRASSRLAAAIPNPLEIGGPTAAGDGQSVTKGDGWAVGYNIGAMIDLGQETRVGFAYRSAMRPKLQGTVYTHGLTGPLAIGNGIVEASARLKLPSIWSASIVRHASEKLWLYAQYDRFGWNSFDQIIVSLDNGSQLARQANYRNAWGASVGLQYESSPQLTYRTGIRFDRTPTQDGFRDTTVPDSSRVWVGAGMSYRWTKTLVMDVAVNEVFFRDAAIDVTRTFFEGTPLATTTRVRGSAKSRVHTISVSLTHSF